MVSFICGPVIGVSTRGGGAHATWRTRLPHAPDRQARHCAALYVGHREGSPCRPRAHDQGRASRVTCRVTRVLAPGSRNIGHLQGSSTSMTSLRAGLQGSSTSMTSPRAGLQGSSTSMTPLRAGLQRLPTSTTHERAGLQGLPTSTTHERAGLQRLSTRAATVRAGLQRLRTCVAHGGASVQRLRTVAAHERAGARRIWARRRPGARVRIASRRRRATRV
jgi:hypothetical protein